MTTATTASLASPPVIQRARGYRRARPFVLSVSGLAVAALFALPAVASSLLMTLFASVDAFWVGTRLGSDGLAAVSTSLFWIWMMVALAEMIGVGLTAVAARRHGEGRSDAAAGVCGDALLFTVAIGFGVTAMLQEVESVRSRPARARAV